ncbi:MAG: hypothetical protein QW279_13460, partial [Candidatus Jordarchaeaceae archaeon]
PLSDRDRVTAEEKREYKEKLIQSVYQAFPKFFGYKLGHDKVEHKLDAKSDLYIYFYFHGLSLLNEKGSFCFITSTSWLDVGYGEDLKQFFLDHFKIHAIIWYDVRALEKALVGTCITILEKEDESKEERENNLVKFVRIKRPMPVQEIARIISSAKEGFENENIGITIKTQGELLPKDKWGVFLKAPNIYFKILSDTRIILMSELAQVKYGIKTGFNDFFILNRDKLKIWSIENEYLQPVVVSHKEIKSATLLTKDIQNYLLMVHKSRKELEGTNVLEYINYGEQMEVSTKRGTRGVSMKVKGIQNLRSVSSRRFWYDLGKRSLAPIIFPYLIWDSHTFVYNKAGALVTDNFHEIFPNSETQSRILAFLGILNSSITALMLELKGRSYGGGVLKVQAYELETLPLLNPLKLSAAERRVIEEAFSKVCEAQRKSDEELEQEARKELDDAVFDVLGLTEDERRQVYEGLESLRRMRLQRKEVEVLVETVEPWKPAKKLRKERAKTSEPSKRLDTWMKD